MTAQTPAERQRKRRRRKNDAKLKKVEVWVPIDSVCIVKELEAHLIEPEIDSLEILLSNIAAWAGLT